MLTDEALYETPVRFTVGFARTYNIEEYASYAARVGLIAAIGIGLVAFLVAILAIRAERKPKPSKRRAIQAER